MSRFGLTIMLLLAACSQQLPPAASAEDIERAVTQAEKQQLAARGSAASRSGLGI
jgi:outer membrane biogenesis lipoprotein LolB